MASGKLRKSSITGTFHHVGLVVKDADETADFYESIGLGPFEDITFKVKDRKLRGEPLPHLKLKIRMAHTGPTRIELIQPIEGEGPWFEFMAKHGEGVAHVAFVVDDLQKSKEELVKRGLKVLTESLFEDGGSAYLESDKLGGTVVEIIQRPSDYVPREKTRKIEEIAFH
jgi:methylmalonyl-CoA/ethylmalonyl-CoA epimerase